ncbi:AAA family ATPase [Aliarcobacter butzleri]|uniref:AAA family ATPase n=1 Tax=Aliarcobacter butzleri TaxID=28197 RepID=UPI0024DE970A|nr:AAA family ATPase [Aliarcobacter butzleri]MDK2051274.1 AAA family ATPase [Aliarcobacter butzleri]
MELVYLWVEDYKNIHKQGFNFSPRFKCEYDEEKNELEIIDKDETGEFYPKNFFGDNINVTAIVGENGSGKTSISNFIKDISKPLYQEEEKKVLILFKKKEIDKFEYISNIDDIKTDTKFISNKSNKLSINILNYSAEFQKEKNHDDDIIISPNEIAKILTDNFIYKKDFKLSSFMFIPKTIEISFNSNYLNEQLENTLENKKQRIINKTFNVSFDEEKESEKDMRNSIYNLQDHSEELFSIEDTYHKFLIIWFIENYYFDSDNLMNKKFLIVKYKIQESNEQISEDELLVNFSKKINDFTDREKEIYFESFHQYFSFNFIDSLQREFKDLSHGERVLFGQLINIYHYISQSEKSFILNLDEPELSLHPNWQKNYIFEITNLLKQFDNKIHLIVTSHSPFILSDLPKENVVFLEKGKQVYPFEDGKQTFGANIHTLLSHGFFMKDGLMGEFAKKKIDLAIKYLNQKLLTEDELNYCENIISIIGEPIIKRELQRMLDSKRLSEIDLIKKQIAELQQELDKKENKK